MKRECREALVEVCALMGWRTGMVQTDWMHALFSALSLMHLGLSVLRSVYVYFGVCAHLLRRKARVLAASNRSERAAESGCTCIHTTLAAPGHLQHHSPILFFRQGR